jgi:hypothetical protein
LLKRILPLSRSSEKISKGEHSDESHGHLEVQARHLQTPVEQFLRTGGKPPEGMKTVGRWHVPGSILGWHLLEGDNLTALAQHVAESADVIDLEVNPVIEDAAAAEAAKRVFGK